jgi:hypothetical protein
MEHRLGTPAASRAVFVGSLRPLAPAQPQRHEGPRQLARAAELNAHRVFSDAVLQWWDVHAGYFGFRPVQDKPFQDRPVQDKPFQDKAVQDN